MGGGTSIPPAPDPRVTGAAQTATNVETARVQAALNRLNQVGPEGRITYSQAPPTQQFDEEGYKKAYALELGSNQGAFGAVGLDENGQPLAGTLSPEKEAALRARFTSTTPSDQYTVTTELSPQNQYLYDLSKRAQTTYGETAGQQLEAVRGMLSQPFQGQPYRDYGDNALQVTSGAASSAMDQMATPFSDPGKWSSEDAATRSWQAASKASELAGQPINTDYNAVRQQAIDAANSRLQPQFAQQEDALRTRLLNSGIPEGSEAWNRAYQQMNQSQNDARMQALLNAEALTGQAIQQTGALRGIPLSELGQASALASAQGQEATRAFGQAAQARQIPFQEAQVLSGLSTNIANQSAQRLQQEMAMRAQPINEASALLTGQQVGTPAAQQVVPTQVAPTDYLGAVNSAYGGQVAGAQSRNQAQQAMMGGLTGLAGTLGGAALLSGLFSGGGAAAGGMGAVGGALPLFAASDRRLKTDIRRVGETKAGLPIYTYRYKDGGPTQMGVMAQDVARKKPSAVGDIGGGFLGVDYRQVA